VEHFKFYAQDRAGIEVQTIAADGTVYVLDSQNFDKAAIRTYDPVTKTLGEPLYSDPEFEMGGVVTDRYNQKGKNDVIGYVLSGPDRTIIYTDPAWQDLIKRVNAALPQRDNSISSITRDKTLAVIYSSSTTHAGSYYLLVNGRQLLPLGERYPHLKEEQLAGMKFVYYKARDGLKIPAFLATPKTGKAPYPTIILPHGGPWARDYLSFDPWVQFLADRGYAVLQPQYRGSQGWGQKLWRAGDKEWGQKMQDDKDDGAAWLVEQGIADKDRIAMFGYSYGGYAAMAAVVRPNSPYQCAIAGAGLSELDSFDKVTFTNPFNRNFQNPTIDGLSPLYNIKDANIPLLLFHGDRDIRVPVDQSRKYYKALKKAGHDVQYVEIPDLWHSNPWFPQHKAVMYTELERYLANDCGPGGL
ncbi:MAG: alpha/beta fold hydrolase, partial [Cellvibrionaceae bacterium]|nr:alpha/beta fold hydrolase [Cellvibrionaceae bacterium]